MALSKSTRIILLLCIDSAFFLLELIVGYWVHSLALVADSFHMLNDVLSLCVGLWAVKVAKERGSSKEYTYGWQRAETLGALINGVFLVALCVTIFLDACSRFAEPQEVSKPKLVLIVGCLGLASNILGLVLFHDHSHSQGHSHGHGEGHADAVEAAEHGHSHAVPIKHDHSGTHGDSVSSDTTAVENGSPLAHQKTQSSSRSGRQRKHSRSQSRVFMNVDDIPTSATGIRNSIIQRSHLEPVDSDEDVPNDEAEQGIDTHTHDQSPLLNGNQSQYGAVSKRKPIDHSEHNHAKPSEPTKGGHSHGDLNMRGIFLHVMGDALGNIGVIATALVIWLTHYSWRFYFDPAISLVITCIILASAIPLCKAASRILLQAVPAGIDVDAIQEDIEDLPGIISCHHLHVWQLSDTKKVASLHVQVEFDVKGEGSASYMELAQAINKCLHDWGIHSSTIQPEFCLDPNHEHSVVGGDAANDDSPTSSGRRSKPISRIPSKAGSMRETDCLLGCPDEGCGGKACCEPVPKDGQ